MAKRCTKSEESESGVGAPSLGARSGSGEGEGCAQLKEAAEASAQKIAARERVVMISARATSLPREGDT